MDPALFRIDYEILFEQLAVVTVLAIFVERALSLLFEHRFFIRKLDKKGWKEPIALGVSAWVVYMCGLDVLAIVFRQDSQTVLGYLITGAIVAGGSKGSIQMFHRFGVMSSEAKKAKARG